MPNIQKKIASQKDIASVVFMRFVVFLASLAFVVGLGTNAKAMQATPKNTIQESSKESSAKQQESNLKKPILQESSQQESSSLDFALQESNLQDFDSQDFDLQDSQNISQNLLQSTKAQESQESQEVQDDAQSKLNAHKESKKSQSPSQQKAWNVLHFRKKVPNKPQFGSIHASEQAEQSSRFEYKPFDSAPDYETNFYTDSARKIQTQQTQPYFELGKFLRLENIEISSFTTYASIRSQMLSPALGDRFESGYSALFARFTFETPKLAGIYLGGTLSALAHLSDIGRKNVDRGTPEIISLFINNDEAKDIFLTSDKAHIAGLYVGVLNKSETLGVRIGRYGARYEWLGDYLEGGEIYGHISGVRLAFGGFYRQSYANPSENSAFGHIKRLYEAYQGYDLKMNFYADANYESENLQARIYANYLHSLYAVAGFKLDFATKELAKDTNFSFLLHANFVTAGVQEPYSALNYRECGGNNFTAHQAAANAGLVCYKKNSFKNGFGELNGGMLHLEGRAHFGGLTLAAGYVGNDKNGATDLLPIYADNNPLEYNTYIYGEGGQSGYVRIDYRRAGKKAIKEFGGFIGYGRSVFFPNGSLENSHFSNQAVGELELSLANIHLHLTVAYIDEWAKPNSMQSKSLISKLWLGYMF